jgi:APA family basic amino acid/polyamine antiporter
MQLGSFKIYYAQIVSILLIVFLTWVNTRGIKSGKLIQTTFTVVKLLSLFGLIVFGLMLAAKSEIWNANWQDAWGMKNRAADGTVIGGIAGSAVLGAIAAAMVGSIFSSDAWNNVTFIAGEVRNPKRNIGLALFLGTLIVTVIYVSANLMYVSVLPLQDIASAPQDRVAVSASKAIFGNIGTYVIAVMIMISTFGCNNGLILAGARVYYTMAKDGLFFKKTGTLNQNDVPAFALWIQCVVAGLLCLSGKYGDLLDMISFVVVLFYALTIAGIFILRKKRPDIERPYKAFGYPILPAIYILMAISFCVLLIGYKPAYAGWGLGIVLAGIPIYYIAVANQNKQAS